jgi:hypothetical protein
MPCAGVRRTERARFSPMRDDGGRSMESTTMSDDKEDDFLSQMATSDADEADAGDKPDADKPDGEKAEKGDPGEPEKKDTAAPPATELDKKEPEHVPLAALKAEREKRQALERQLAELRTTSKQPGADKAQDTTDKQAAAASFYDDPEGFVRTQITQAQRQAESRLYAALEADAREQFPDFDEVMEQVVERVKENPALREQIFRSPNPARAAYRLGKQFRDADALQKDPEAVREQIRAEERARLEAEFKARDEAKRKTADAIPPDLAATRSTTGATSAPAGGVFADIFPE